MANEIIFVYKEDTSAAERIIDAFAAETGLRADTRDRDARFAVHGREHEIKVVETLNRIDTNWSRYVSLGHPGASGTASA